MTETPLPPEPETVVPKSGLHGVGLIYGQPKIGKSTLATSLVDVTIDTEAGLNHIAGVRRYLVKSLLEYRSAIDAAHKLGYRRISIDTLDNLNYWVEQAVAKRYEVKSVADLDYGKGYRNCLEILLQMINDLRARFDLVLLVGHQRLAIFETTSVKARIVELPGKMSRKICAEMDFLGFCEIENDTRKRFVNFCPYEEHDSGSRIPELSEQRIEFFKDIEQNKAVFDRLFTKTQEGESNGS